MEPLKNVSDSGMGAKIRFCRERDITGGRWIAAAKRAAEESPSSTGQGAS